MVGTYCILLKKSVYLQWPHRYADGSDLSNHVSCSNSCSERTSIARTPRVLLVLFALPRAYPFFLPAQRDTLIGENTSGGGSKSK